MVLSDIVRICNGNLLSNNEDIKCESFSKDTRNISAGDIYIGIKGESFNGNNFYKDAFEKGAAACILDEDTVIDEEYKTHNIVLVKDTIKALQDIAKYKRSLYDIPVIAVTGSVGKTSVKDIIYKVVSSKYKTQCTPGNLNNHIGVPLTILGLKDHEVLIVEMGMNHLGEIHTLSEIANPTIAVITNIGTAHIGNLGSRENILKAKMEIVDGMKDGTLIINNDNDLLHTITYPHKITIGINEQSDYMAKNITNHAFSTEFDIGNTHITIPVGSDAFIYNSLFAYAVGKELNIDDGLIATALADFKLSPHRLELINLSKYQLIDDTYNASLDSVKSSLSVLKKVNARKVFIFADILELEDFAKDIHKEVGKIAAENGVDLLLTVGKNAYETHLIAKELGVQSYHFDNNADLIKALNTLLQTNDTILVKGSHGMKLLEIVEYLKNS